jgi:hypothetical protein
MALKALLVLGTKKATWLRAIDLAIPPFPGLGIRLDVYKMVNVISVVVGDHPYEVTCIVQMEKPGEEATEKELQSLGFEIGSYP